MPKEGTAQGKIVLDGSWEGHTLGDPVQLTIKDGLLVLIRDKMSADIESFFDQSGEAMRSGKGHLVRTLSEFSLE